MITQRVGNNRSFSLTITTLATLGMLAMLGACSSQPLERTDSGPPVRVESRPTVPPILSFGDKAAAVALQQVGVPYRYGGTTTSGFDCSGLVQYSYGQVGKMVPRTTGQLWSSTATVRRENLQAGDLLFFSIAGKMSHVGMYLGGQRFVHAPSSGRKVTVADLNSRYYSAAFIRAGRPK